MRMFRSVGIALKQSDSKALLVFKQLLPLLKIYHTKRVISHLYLDWESAKIAEVNSIKKLSKDLPLKIQSIKNWADRVDLLLSIGGDGTLLRSARHLLSGDGWKKAHLLGINAGHLGFLTYLHSSSSKEALKKLFESSKEKVSSESRSCLAVTIKARGKKQMVHAMNDAVLSKGALSRLFEFDVSIDNHFLSSYRADGMVVSSPTGSTAYNLAAGGAILTPSIEALQLTPICPQSLTNKPIVVSDASRIVLRLGKHSSDVFVTLDGHLAIKMETGDRVEVRKSPKRIQLVLPPGVGPSHYYQSLRQKLRWGLSAKEKESS